MKKYTLVLFMLIFSFGLFNLNANSASANITITTSKDVYSSMFPQTNCSYSNNPICVSGIRYDKIKIDQSSNPPSIWGSELRFTGPAGEKSNTASPRRFSLADPLNPARDTSIAQNSIDTYNNTFGDFGPGLYADYIAMSKDGAYQFVLDSQGETFGWHNGKEIKLSAPRPNNLVGVVNHGDKTLLITATDALDVTGMDTFPSQQYTGNTYSSLTVSLNKYGPTMAGGTKYILSNTDFIASLEGPLSVYSYSATPKINIYDLGQTSGAVATVNVPALANAELRASFTQSAPDGDYIVLLFAPPFKGPTCTLASFLNPSVCTPGDVYGSQYAAGKVFVYKFDFGAKTLSTVVNGVTIDAGMISSATGFSVGGNLGVLVFRNIWGGLDSGGYDTYTPKTSAYFFSTLASGTATDVLNNAPTGGDKTNIPWSSASLVKGNTTYVYTNYLSNNTFNGGGRILVWQLDSTSGGSSVAICQDSTALNHGGTLPCRYPRPACSPGDSFNTDTGLPCGGTIGTGRKLNCVNLSSSVYCSYTPDTLVTTVPSTPLSPVLSPIKSFQFTLLLKNGSTGSEVTELQKFLNTAGYDCGTADGSFGPKTQAAVIKFQIANGLVGDGIVGPATRALLNS
jgi:Putative peptidoglycan binding domain